MWFPCTNRAGPVTKVTICKEKDGKPKTFGFACFKHTESVPYAIALLNGIRLYGRPIKVQYRFGSSHCPELSNHCQNTENNVDIQSPTYSHFQVNSSPPQGYSAFQYMMSNFLAQQYTPYPMGQQFPFYQMMMPPPPPFPRLPLSPNPNPGQNTFDYVYSETKNHMLHLVNESRPKRKRYQETSDSDSSIENDRKKTKRK